MNTAFFITTLLTGVFLGFMGTCLIVAWCIHSDTKSPVKVDFRVYPKTAESTREDVYNHNHEPARL